MTDETATTIGGNVTNSIVITNTGEINFNVEIGDLLLRSQAWTPGQQQLVEQLVGALIHATRNKTDPLSHSESWPAPWGRLPQLDHRFINRQSELSLLRNSLRDPAKALIVVTGIPGIGKTWLVINVLLESWNLQTHESSYGSIYFVRCNEETVTLERVFLNVGQFIGRAKDFEQRWKDPHLSLGDKVSFLLEALRQTPCLLIFDNFESLLQEDLTIRNGEDLEIFFLRMMAEVTGSKVILTSRSFPDLTHGRQSRSLVHVPLIEGLDFNYSIALLTELGVHEPERILRLAAQKTGGLPRALESMAGLAASGLLAEALEDKQLFYGEIAAKLLIEQLNSLTADEYKTLISGAIFRRSVSINGIKWLVASLNAESHLVHNLLSLMHKRLLHYEESSRSYGMHPLVREVVQMRLSAPEYVGLHHQAAEAYMLFSKQAGSRPRDLSDLDNDLEAHFHYTEAGEYDKAGLIATFAFSYLFLWGYYNLAERLIKQTIEQCTGSLQAVALHQQARLDFSRGDVEQAENLWLKAMAIFETINDTNKISSTLHHLGRVAQLRGQYELAFRYYRQAQDLAEENQDWAQLGLSAHQVAYSLFLQGKIDEAIAESRQALDARMRAGDRTGEGITRHLLGLIQDVRGEYDEALDSFNAALEIAKELNEKVRTAIALRSRGGVYFYRGEYALALRDYAESLSLVKDLSALSLAECLDRMADLDRVNGRYEAALDRYTQSLDIREKAGLQVGIAQSRRNLGILNLELGNLPVARQLIESGLALAKERNLLLQEFDCLLYLGIVDRRENQCEASLVCFNSAMQLATNMGYQAGIAQVLHQIGELHLDQDKAALAVNYLRDSYAIFARLKRSPDQQRVARAQARLSV